MILCFQCEDLSKIFLVSKFEMNRPNIKLIITFCAIWHYRDFKGYMAYQRIRFKNCKESRSLLYVLYLKKVNFFILHHC